MLEELKKEVFRANLMLVENRLVVLTWGNASGRDPETGLIVIKPSGVSYEGMTAEDMVVIDKDANVIEGKYRPSSDTPTHLYIYERFPSVGGIVHTHSTFATAFAQSARPIPAYGTTHADAFYGDIPCTRALTAEEIKEDYEKNTGKVICENFDDEDIMAMPAVLVKNHGAFTWGKNAAKAAENAITLEEVAKMAYLTRTIEPDTPRVEQYLLDKHYFRKHGKNAYYGQDNN